MFDRFTKLHVAVAFVGILILLTFSVPVLADEDDSITWDFDLEEILGENMELVQQQMEQIEKQMELFSERMEGVQEQFKNQIMEFQKEFDSSEFKLEDLNTILKQMEMEIPKIALALPGEIDIEIPEINIPAIKIPKIDIEFEIPEIPDFSGISNGRKNFHGETVSEKIEKSFEVEKGTELTVDSSFGTLEIVPAKEPSTLSVFIEKGAGAKTKEWAQELLDNIEVSITQKDGSIEVTGNIGDDIRSIKGDKMRYVDIKVSVPQNIPIKAKHSFGTLAIQGIEGNIECENSFGSTIVKDTKGALDVKTSHGSANVVNQDGNTKVKSQFGTLSIDGISGELDVKSSHGKTTIKKTSNNVQLQGEFSFGSVDISLPGDFAGNVEAKAKMGKIDAPTQLKKTKEMMAESVSGTIGSGEGDIRLRSEFSSVKISMQG